MLQSFSEFLTEALKFDKRKHKWATIKYKDGSAHHIILSKKTNEILAGGGPLNGRVMHPENGKKQDQKESEEK